MPVPILPFGSVSAPAQPTVDPLLALIAQNFAGAQEGIQRDYTSLAGTLESALQDVMNQPGPTLAPVPGTPSPLARGAATFAGLLSEQLGAPNASALVQGRLAEHEQAARQVQAQNEALVEADRRQRMKDILELRGKISDARIEALKEGRDIANLERELKTRYQIDMALQKERDRAAKERAEIVAAGALERKRTPTPTTPKGPEEGLSIGQYRQETIQQNFIDDIEKVGKTEDGTVIGPFEFGQKDRLRPGAIRARRQRAATTARQTKVPELRNTALEVYYYSLLDEKGEYDVNDPEALAWARLVATTIPDLQERIAFLNTIGVQGK